MNTIDTSPLMRAVARGMARSVPPSPPPKPQPKPKPKSQKLTGGGKTFGQARNAYGACLAHAAVKQQVAHSGHVWDGQGLWEQDGEAKFLRMRKPNLADVRGYLAWL